MMNVTSKRSWYHLLIQNFISDKWLSVYALLEKLDLQALFTQDSHPAKPRHSPPQEILHVSPRYSCEPRVEPTCCLPSFSSSSSSTGGLNLFFNYLRRKWLADPSETGYRTQGWVPASRVINGLLLMGLMRYACSGDGVGQESLSLFSLGVDRSVDIPGRQMNVERAKYFKGMCLSYLVLVSQTDVIIGC